MQFLSMKLASVNPMLYDLATDLDTLLVKPEVSNYMCYCYMCTMQLLQNNKSSNEIN